jgi:hypothetical protein
MLVSPLPLWERWTRTGDPNGPRECLLDDRPRILGRNPGQGGCFNPWRPTIPWAPMELKLSCADRGLDSFNRRL